MPRFDSPERSLSGASRCLPAALLLAASLSVLSPTPVHAHWPSFQNGGRISLDGAAGAQQSTIRWTSNIVGYGQSSPVVWGENVYVTSVSGPQRETYHVTAFRLSDGSKRWQHDLKNASPRENTTYMSRAAPTPAADGDGVVCFFEGGNVIALSHDGRIRWERNLVEEFGPVDARHGLAASVEQLDSTAFIWVERSENPYVLALEKESGTTVWKAPGIGATSWASPRLVPVDGGHHLVLSGSGTLVGLDPASGARLWSLSGITGNTSPTPVPVGNGRFLQGATVGRGEPGSGPAAASNGVVAIAKNTDGQWQADYLWRADRATSSFGSPIAHRGHCYFVNDVGVVYCLDLNSGEERFAKRLEESTWATPIAVGDQILFFGKSGTICGIASGAKYHALSSKAAWETEAPASAESASAGGGKVLYGAAVVGNRVIARSGSELRAWTVD